MTIAPMVPGIVWPAAGGMDAGLLLRPEARVRVWHDVWELDTCFRAKTASHVPTKVRFNILDILNGDVL